MASQDWFDKDFYAILGVPQDAEDRVEVLLEPVLAGHGVLLSVCGADVVLRGRCGHCGSATATRAGLMTWSPAR